MLPKIQRIVRIVRVGVKQVPEKKNLPAAKKPAKKKMGRPPIPAAKREAMIEQILFDMSHNGQSLRQSCSNAGLAVATFFDWRNADPILSDRYAKARLDMYDYIADETVRIADEEYREIEVDEQDAEGNWIKVTKKVAVDTQRSRLRVDTRKWLLSKIAPKQYGDKQVVDNISSDGSMSPKAPTRIELVAKTEVDK